MLGIFRTAVSVSSRPMRGQVRAQAKVTTPRKLTHLAKRQKWSVRAEDMPAPGSHAWFKVLKQIDGAGETSVDYSAPERILTLNDLEYNREASTVNGRLRHLVNIDASYQEAFKVAQEAVDSGIELDMQSYIYLSTLFKPHLAACWEQAGQMAQDALDEYRQTFVPDAGTITAFLKEVKGASDAEVVQEVLKVIRNRKPKLDVEAVQALDEAHHKIGSNAKPIIDQLHKDFIIDTPTYDTFMRISQP